MKSKIKYLLLLLILLIPSFVLAKDTCNDNDIKIKSITLKELTGFSEEIQESSINNNTINLNLKMYDVGDSSTYEITVENTSNEDYYFTKDSMKLENDYLEYNLKNDSELIPAKEEKTIELKVSYKNKIPNDSYSDTSKLIISLSDKPLENPKTKMTYTFIFIIISLIAITIYTKINKKSLSKKKLLLVLTLLSIIPITTTALCTVNLNVETKIEIENKEAVFLPGSEVNIKMKELAGDDTSTVTNGYTFQDENITAIRYSLEEPTSTNKEDKNIVSTTESPYPIYMWYDNGTIYWWSEDIHPDLNEDASYMFAYLKILNDISGLEYFDTSSGANMQGLLCRTSISDLTVLCHWDVSNVQNMSTMFASTSIQSLNGLENWDTSKVINMTYTFAGCRQLESIEGLENWNTSSVEYMFNLFTNDISLKSISSIKNWDVRKVKSMRWMFCCCFSIEEIDLSNWETLSLEDMQYMFAQLWINIDGQSTTGGILKRIILSEKFDTSKVTNMSYSFYNNRVIEDYSFLKYLDTSSVTNMQGMFYGNYKFNDTIYLKDWNVSNVEDMTSMFTVGKSLSTLDGLENWDVSRVNNMTHMFSYNSNLTDASAINDWDISPTAIFTYMFSNSPTHPEFSKVPGTWKSNGTFTPTT